MGVKRGIVSFEIGYITMVLLLHEKLDVFKEGGPFK